MNTSPAQPWNRKAGEPGAAYVLFCKYRNMGENRNVGSLAKDLNLKKTASLRQLADQWAWAHRADQWDGYVAQKKSTEAGHATILQAREEARAVGYLARAARIVPRSSSSRSSSGKLAVSAGQVVLLVDVSTKLA